MHLRGNINLKKAVVVTAIVLTCFIIGYFVFISLQSQAQKDQESSTVSAYLTIGTRSLTKSEFEDMTYFMRYYEKKTETQAKDELVNNLKYIEAAKKIGIVPGAGIVASDVTAEFSNGTYKNLDSNNPWPGIVAQKKAIDVILASTQDFKSLHATVYEVSFTQNMKLEREDLLKNGYTEVEQAQIDKDKEYALSVANKVHDDLNSGVDTVKIKEYLGKDKRIYTYGDGRNAQPTIFEVNGVYKNSALDDVVRDYILQADNKGVSEALLGPVQPSELVDILSAGTYYAVINIDSYDGLSDINKAFNQAILSIEVSNE